MATRENSMAWLITMIVAGFIEVNAAAAATYMVGDELGWTVPSNISYYQSWATSKTFMVGDKLYFNWTGTHNVAKVSEAEYDNCTQVVSALASPVDLQLLKGGSHHYICTVDSHCKLGQKLSITIGPAAAAAPTSPSNSASSTALKPGVVASAFITIACLKLLCHYTGH